jgi:tRNA-guanine transglycosylase/Holliday junction DNA helicase RuvB subunit
VKANLSVLLQAAKGRGEAADHILLYGPPGLGKTTLATIVARELGVNVRYTSGPAVERAGDLASVLTSLDDHDVLFIDEIHRLNRAVEEILYPAMEDYALDVMIGKGPSARSLRLSLKPFTVVGATTRAGRISGPLRDRFGATYRLDFYTDDELAAIVDRSAAILGVEIEPAATRAIARRGRGTPRIVNRLLKRVRDHAEVHGDGRVNETTAREAMRAMEIDDEGLDSTDRKLLAAIVQKFASGPVGVAALAAVLSEEIETIEDVYEPFLLRLGFIDRTPQGRIATDLARAHLSAPRRGRDAEPVGRPARRRPGRGGRVTAGYVGQAARYEVQVPPPADGSTRARVGQLTLTHGTVETPQFMPVGTNATVKALTPAEIAETGASIILANTYHLYLRPGADRIERLGGLHRFMDWDGPILTDSGGFQVVSLGDLRVVDDDGVTFRSHLDGSTHRFTPEVAIGAQESLGSDIAVAFDQPVFPTSPRAVVADATERTHRWAERSLAAHQREDQALFGIVQGGLDPELRAASTRFIASLPFDGICLGGLAGDETPAQRDATLDLAVPLLDDDPRPRYLMGLGSPADLLEAVHRGVDLFDSVLPARVARNGQLWVPGGRLNIRNRAFSDDPAPIQDDCPCLACRRFSRAYLAHLFRAGELLAYRLATCHNLTFTLDFMARVRASIRAGTFPASMAELRSRAGRMSVDEGAGKSA